ncbi:CBM_collapsed_G0018760.mRNA.1.CDS.1 [Saccharomyces cerevisiae]|nr:CBM_collapsed_G0018760.mRNA.1.CDS.1 [Saccharomyces cerevisiae]
MGKRVGVCLSRRGQQTVAVILQPLKENLTCAVRVSVSSMHNHGKTAFCVTYSHGDSWRAELRVVANDAWSHYYPWSIDCPEVDTNNMAINDCFDQAQG